MISRYRRKTIDYGVVSSESQDLLVDQINTLMDSGWEPYGDLFKSGVKFTQAIVKKAWVEE